MRWFRRTTEGPKAASPPARPAPGERSPLGQLIRDAFLGDDERMEAVLEAQRKAASAQDILDQIKRNGGVSDQGWSRITGEGRGRFG